MYFEKFPKLYVSMVSVLLLSLRPQEFLVMYKVFLFSSSVLHYFMHKTSLVGVKHCNYVLLYPRRIIKERI